MIDERFFDELLAWSPWIFGFMAWLVFGGFLVEVILPRFPKLDAWLDSLIERL